MRWWVACLAAVLAKAQALPDLSLLDKVKARAQENLRRLPDYTCTENVERSLRAHRERRLRHWDTVHLNVAYVGGKEFFGLPGTGRVDQVNFDKLVSPPIGNGQFALFVQSIFVDQRAMFGPASKTRLDGKPAFRFDYQVPLARSGFRIKSSMGEAIVGYSGRFWVARDTLDLMRLVLSGDNLPRSVGIVTDVTTTDYGGISIGGSVFLLPQRSTYQTTDLLGAQARNVMTFENCRQYVGESVLKFEDGAPPPSNK